MSGAENANAFSGLKKEGEREPRTGQTPKRDRNAGTGQTVI